MASDLPSPPELHELETEVMEEVSRHDEASVRDIMETLNTRTRKERAYTTYMTIMARLDSKGLLERTRKGKGCGYSRTSEECLLIGTFLRWRDGSGVRETRGYRDNPGFCAALAG